jgi:hypothetical protein
VCIVGTSVNGNHLLTCLYATTLVNGFFFKKKTRANVCIVGT